MASNSTVIVRVVSTWLLRKTSAALPALALPGIWVSEIDRMLMPVISQMAL